MVRRLAGVMVVEKGRRSRRQNGTLVTETVMSKPYLPREVLDHIIDILCDEREALKQCCLVSKSWVPSTRKHLFAHIRFRSPSDLDSWKKTFLDVANSPARHARELLVGCPWHVVAADAEEGGWIQAFSGVTSLKVTVDHRDHHPIPFEVSLSLTPFHNFSSALKSLHVDPIHFHYPRLSNLVRSFPLLENLSLAGRYMARFDDDHPHGPQTVIPSTSPPLSGNLNFHVSGGAGKVARQLLDLPNGLHFQHLALSWDPAEDVWWITELVVLCSHSLESLDIISTLRSMSIRIWSTPLTLNSFTSGIKAKLVQPLESGKTTRCGFPTRIAGR